MGKISTFYQAHAMVEIGDSQTYFSSERYFDLRDHLHHPDHCLTSRMTRRQTPILNQTDAKNFDQKLKLITSSGSVRFFALAQPPFLLSQSRWPWIAAGPAVVIPTNVPITNLWQRILCGLKPRKHIGCRVIQIQPH